MGSSSPGRAPTRTSSPLHTRASAACWQVAAAGARVGGEAGDKLRKAIQQVEGIGRISGVARAFAICITTFIERPCSTSTSHTSSRYPPSHDHTGPCNSSPPPLRRHDASLSPCRRTTKSPSRQVQTPGRTRVVSWCLTTLNVVWAATTHANTHHNTPYLYSLTGHPAHSL